MSLLILASQSPRRKELLKKLQIPFQVVASNIDERLFADLPPTDLVVTLAEQKAKAVSRFYPDSFVIGADTIVTLDNEILGKPSDRQEAKQMLKRLSGRTHTVYTGVAVAHKQIVESFIDKTEVTFWEVSEEEIDSYLDSGEPFDKAGAYGIQGLGALFVQAISGDYYSVVGLPIARLSRLLTKMGCNAI